MQTFTILTINPGSTSTKIAVFENETLLFEKTLRHTSEELEPYKTVSDQFEFRKSVIIKALEDEQFDLNRLSAIVGRGGLLHPLASGVYQVNDLMKSDLRESPIGEHASNLGGLIADNIATSLPGVEAFIADPVVVDEMDDIARMTGHPLFTRSSIFHALNQKAVGRAYSKQIGKKYEDLNLIIAHMGGGVSVGAHLRGRVVDVNNALDGEGPFSPERAGTLPVGPLVNLCFSGKFTLSQVKKMVKGEGGIMAHLGINDARQAREMAAAGDIKAQQVLDSMCYSIAKYIGSMAVALSGEVDAILLTGGIAYSDQMMAKISQRVKFIAPISIFPGEDEMLALAQNGLMVLTGEVTPSVYVGKTK